MSKKTKEFEKGIKVGAAPFEKKFNSLENRQQENNIEIVNELADFKTQFHMFADVILESDPSHKEELLQLFKEQQDNSKTPARYVIRIIATESLMSVGKDLRIKLMNRDNGASVQAIDEYQKDPTLADYYIHLGFKSSEPGLNNILDAYGCHIDCLGRHIYAYSDFFGDIAGVPWKDWLEFKQYYEKVTGESASENADLSAADKIIQKKRKIDDAPDDVVDSILGGADAVRDFMEDKLGPIGKILSLPADLVAGGSGLIIGTVTAIGSSVANAFNDEDARYVASAQSKIIATRLDDYIMRLQAENCR